MNISDYADKARSTAIYPKSAIFYYPALGLAGEIGEIIDKLTQLSKEVPANKEAVTKEAGDALWYVVNTAADAKIPLVDLVDIVTGGGSIDSFSELGALRHHNDRRSALIKLPIYAGCIAEIAKKMLRDSGGELTSEKRDIVRESLAEILICLCTIAKEWSINMDDVAQANIDKLFSRKERGVLQGDGDNR